MTSVRTIDNSSSPAAREDTEEHCADTTTIEIYEHNFHESVVRVC